MSVVADPGCPVMGELESRTGRFPCPGRCPAQQHGRLLIVPEPHPFGSQSTESRAHPAWGFATTFTSRYVARRDKDGKFPGHSVFFSLLHSALMKFAIVLSPPKKTLKIYICQNN